MRLRPAAGAALFVATAVLTVAVLSALRFGVGAVPFGRPMALALGNLLAGQPDGRVFVVDSPPGPLVLTHGVASGVGTPTSAVVWGRLSGPGEIAIAVTPKEPPVESPPITASAQARADTDFAAAVLIEGLHPNTAYTYEVTASSSEANIQPGGIGRGHLRTPPAAQERADLSLVFGGDLGGGGFCRDAASGYAIFDAMTQLQPDLFIAMGDMIYADNVCPDLAPDSSINIPGDFPGVDSRALDWEDKQRMREVYFQHWRYNRADPHFQSLLAQIPLLVLWDDHETINDSGAAWAYHTVLDADRAGYPTLVSAAREALFAYAPVDRDSAEPDRLYRRVSWGADVDLFLLDTRSYRSRNDAADTAANPKTMLGRDQREWLEVGLRQSSAVWKVIVSSVSLSIASGGIGAAVLGRDGWADGTSWDYSAQTGFERELLDLLLSVDGAGIRNVVFLSGDAHQPAVTRFAPDPNGDGVPLEFHEIVAGPLHAPAARGESVLDPTLQPTRLYHESGFDNFGYVRIERSPDGLPHFLADIRDARGSPRRGSALDLTPAP